MNYINTPNQDFYSQEVIQFEKCKKENFNDGVVDKFNATAD